MVATTPPSLLVNRTDPFSIAVTHAVSLTPSPTPSLRRPSPRPSPSPSPFVRRSSPSSNQPVLVKLESMGLCHGKPNQTQENQIENSSFPYYSPSPFHNSSLFKNSPANSSVNSTPLRIFKRPFPPPSPAKHIRALLARRHGSVKPNEALIPEGNEFEVGLDKNFGYCKQLLIHYELGEVVGRGHFGYTCTAKGKKGSMKGHEVAVKVIPKSKMTTVIAIEDARREVKILRALTGHDNLVQFYEAYEDDDNVYI